LTITVVIFQMTKMVQRHNVTTWVNQQFSTQSDLEFVCWGAALLFGLQLAHLRVAPLRWIRKVGAMPHQLHWLWL
jgi:hypothetical protein